MRRKTLDETLNIVALGAISGGVSSWTDLFSHLWSGSSNPPAQRFSDPHFEYAGFFKNENGGLNNVVNDGTIWGQGPIVIKEGGSLVNHGTITNNKDALLEVGPGATLLNERGAAIDNSGVIHVVDDATNLGSIRNEFGAAMTLAGPETTIEGTLLNGRGATISTAGEFNLLGKQSLLANYGEFNVHPDAALVARDSTIVNNGTADVYGNVFLQGSKIETGGLLGTGTLSIDGDVYLDNALLRNQNSMTIDGFLSGQNAQIQNLGGGTLSIGPDGALFARGSEIANLGPGNVDIEGTVRALDGSAIANNASFDVAPGGELSLSNAQLTNINTMDIDGQLVLSNASVTNQGRIDVPGNLSYGILGSRDDSIEVVNTPGSVLPPVPDVITDDDDDDL